MKLQWNQIEWKKAEEQVNRLQIRIVKATLEQKWRLVKRLQYLITNSFYAKALAVRRVVTNPGKKTPGIDGMLGKSDKDKMEAVFALNMQTYHAKPLKRIYRKETAVPYNRRFSARWGDYFIVTATDKQTLEEIKLMNAPNESIEWPDMDGENN